jgi:AraC-like DNA-binding protein
MARSANIIGIESALPKRNVFARTALLAHPGSVIAEPLSATDISVMDACAQHRGVRVGAQETSAWIRDYPCCAALAEYHFGHIGVVSAFSPYHIVRKRQRSPYLLACAQGEGEIRRDGAWIPCRPGMAFLLPPHTYVEFRAIGTTLWEFCYVSYQMEGPWDVIVPSSTPVSAEYDPLPLFHAIEMLRFECLGQNEPASCRLALEMIHRLVSRFAHRWIVTNRLQQLWEKVRLNPQTAWTVEMLAQEAHCCSEHLRRLCHRHLGCSPMEQVTRLRMRAAAERLIGSDAKVESIAEMVGYQTSSSFSIAFKRWSNLSPSEYRLQRLAQENPPPI